MNDQIKNGGYYLHSNGSLISKPGGLCFEDQDSPFVKRYWNNRDIGASPQTFVAFLKEAKECGAMDDEIRRLANHNMLSDYVSDWQEQVGVSRAP